MKPIDKLSESELERLVADAVNLPSAPSRLVNKVIDLWDADVPPTRAELGQRVWRVIEAVLNFDSWAQSATLTGVRGSASQTRHLLFDAKGRDIDLRISPSAGQYCVNGQILGPDEFGVIELSPFPKVEIGADSISTELNDVGEFRIEGVDSGIYELTLRVGDEKIVLPAIEVGD